MNRTKSNRKLSSRVTERVTSYVVNTLICQKVPVIFLVQMESGRHMHASQQHNLCMKLNRSYAEYHISILHTNHFIISTEQVANNFFNFSYTCVMRKRKVDYPSQLQLHQHNHFNNCSCKNLSDCQAIQLLVWIHTHSLQLFPAPRSYSYCMHAMGHVVEIYRAVCMHFGISCNNKQYSYCLNQ